MAWAGRRRAGGITPGYLGQMGDNALTSTLVGEEQVVERSSRRVSQAAGVLVRCRLLGPVDARTDSLIVRVDWEPCQPDLTAPYSPAGEPDAVGASTGISELSMSSTDSDPLWQRRPDDQLQDRQHRRHFRAPPAHPKGQLTTSGWHVPWRGDPGRRLGRFSQDGCYVGSIQSPAPTTLYGTIHRAA